MQICNSVSRLALLIVLLPFLGHAQEANRLSDQDKAAGWRLLFDGKTTKGWRAFKKTTFPAQNWTVEDGWLRCMGKGGGDIITEDQFEEFELEWEWKLSPGGNSGVKYFAVESRGPVGHEYQIIDDARHPDGQKAEGKRVTAAFYDVLKTQVPTPLKEPGQVNRSRIWVKGQHVEHWLNGVKVLEYELGSKEVLEAVAQSKFKTTPGFGTRMKGHILLQDHNDPVWYRNIRIRDLSK
jgi:hypothetical protein